MTLTENKYPINGKDFSLETDFTPEELEWLDIVVSRLEARSEKQEVSGNFTRDEIEKTLIIILPGFTHEDFLKTKESLQVKIIADFFLTKAVLGSIIKNSLMN